MKILLFFGWAAKTIASSYMRVVMGKQMVEAEKLNPNLHQDTIGKPTSRAINWCNNNIVVTVWNNTLSISKVQNVADSYRFWLCPD
jgi:hypothetical protein